VKLNFYLQKQLHCCTFEKASDIYSLGLVLYEILLYATKRDEGFNKQFLEYLQGVPFVNPAEFKEKYKIKNTSMTKEVRKKKI